MTFFKYTVANKEGKKLSGTVEGPDEQTARAELNNLGFSIIALQETQEITQPITGKKFIFEAIDKSGQLISGTIPAPNEDEAFSKLQEEYSLTISAIWVEGSNEKDITAARQKYEQFTSKTLEHQEKRRLEEQKHDQIVRTKIENVLHEVHQLLEIFENDFETPQKLEINKKIDKLLRIKNSTNLEYILETANDLLEFIQNQEKVLAKKGLDEKKFQLKLETKKMLDELNADPDAITLSEDILNKIRGWKEKHIGDNKPPTQTTRLINRILDRIKTFFETPPEIQRIKNQIHAYNKQIWAFIQLYFKESTPEYRNKVKNSIKAVLQQKKKAKHVLAYIKQIRKEKKKTVSEESENLLFSLTEEINLFTGWVLAFYIMYYFASLYISTKNFGLAQIPAGFQIYDSKIFKYALVVIFFLHAATALKLNFFLRNRIASMIIAPVFLITTVITLFNF
ncbi:hypothetical protein HYW82_01695 [Candidatus Peregrinibacteria bacterium]|nr:hypothetical protein [Candidatus Peregrinibacteria bacterium]